MASLSLNKVVLGGRLVADPEMKMTTNGIPFLSIRIAVRRSVKSQGAEPIVDFFNVTFWRSLAEFVSKSFFKGDSIVVVGSLQANAFTNRNGEKVVAYEVAGQEAYFVDSKEYREKQRAASAENEPVYEEGTGGTMTEISAPDDLPF